MHIFLRSKVSLPLKLNLVILKLKDRVSNKELRERLEIVDITSLLQQNRLQWYGHVLRKDDNDG